MRKTKMAVTPLDSVIAELIEKSEHEVLAIWAADCAERVLPYFENKSPNDARPRRAIEALREWALTDVFKMDAVRAASLAAHAAARSVGDDDAARSAARAAGQAMATAHVPKHAQAAAVYAATAVCDAADPAGAAAAALKEREWQYKHLRELSKMREVDK